MEPLKRHSEPTMYDHAPYGTQCIVQESLYTKRVFIQMSRNEDEPSWVEIEN